MNNCGSPTLTIDSPLVATRRRTNTDTTLDDEYVGTWVAFLCTGLTFYGTVKSCFLDRILCTIMEMKRKYFL